MKSSEDRKRSILQRLFFGGVVKVKKPKKKEKAIHDCNFPHSDMCDGCWNNGYSQACIDWEKYLVDLINKLPKVTGYSPEATKVLKEYRDRVVKIIREVEGEP